MTTQFLSLFHGVRSQLEGCQRVAWFVFESFEREHLLTLRALSATLPTLGIPWAFALHPLARTFPAVTAAEPPRADADARNGQRSIAGGRQPPHSRRPAKRPPSATRHDTKSGSKLEPG